MISTVIHGVTEGFGTSQGLYKLEEFPGGPAIVRGRLRISGIEGSRGTANGGRRSRSVVIGPASAGP